MAVADQHWPDIDGYAIAHGVDIEELEYPRYVNFVWYWLIRNGDQEQITKVKDKLWQPPKGEVGKGVWSAESENEAFQSLKQGLGQ